MTRRRWHAAVIALLLLVSAPACAGVHELRADQLSITSPSELATVQVPFTLQWRTRDLPASVTQYAVFVDRGPMSPGEDVRSLADDECRRRRGCPDAAYLRTRNVYLSPDSQVAIPTLPTLAGLAAQTAYPVHQVVVVALDDHGRRVGEFFATAQIRFER